MRETLEGDDLGKTEGTESMDTMKKLRKKF